VLPSGPLPPNPGDIVNSRRFGQIIKALEKEADLVIVDSPAMLAVGDTAALAGKVDGLVFLVDMHVLKRPQLVQAVEQLYKLPVKLLGVMVRSESARGAGRYDYYGSYGYYEYSAGHDGGRGKRGGRNGQREKRETRAAREAAGGAKSERDSSRN
jgi:Mrp family chromosome partitioning ATPase